MCALLTLPILYGWGRWQSGPKVGLAAAAFYALAPMAAYYSREAKGYPFVTLFATLQTYVWARHLLSDERPPTWAWLVFMVSGVLALGAHYYVILLFIVQGAWMLFSGRRTRARLSSWVGAMLTIGLCVAPWVWLTFGTATQGAFGLDMGRDAWGVLGFARHVGLELAGGPHGGTWASLAALLAMLVAGLAGVLHLRGRGGALLAVLIVGTLALAYAVQRLVPFFAPRFLLYLLPYIGLLVGAGVARLGRLGWALAAGLLLAWGLAYPGVYAPFAPAEDDMRPLVAPLREWGRDEDGIIVGYIWQEGILRMHLPELRAEYSLGWYDPTTLQRAMLREDAEHDRIWLVSYRTPTYHPNNPAGVWLEERATRALVARHHDHRITLYVDRCADSGNLPETISWERGFAVDYDDAPRCVAAGDVLAVTLRWSVSPPPRQHYVAFLHLTTPDGQVAAQTDGAPRNGIKSFRTFRPSEEVTDCPVLMVPRDLAPGPYQVRVGLYDPRSGDRLHVISDEEQVLEEATVIGVVNVLAHE
jgi:hypothetical protein